MSETPPLKRLGGLLPPVVPRSPSTEPPSPDASWSDDEPRCKTCRDGLWVRDNVPLGDPRFGKTRPCPDCTEVPTAIGLPEDLVSANFERWHPQTNPQGWNRARNPAMKAAYERCKAVAAGDTWCALLTGHIGTGKTHLAAAALNASVHPKPGRFWVEGELLERLRHLMFHRDLELRRDEAELVTSWQTHPGLLVIDDMAATIADDKDVSNFHQRMTYLILSGRYTRRLPTILTTNNLAKVDERIRDRFHEGAIVCEGESARP